MAQWILLGLATIIVVLLVTNEQYRLNFLSGPAIVKGALVAAIGIGIVLTYKGAGVINFANGAIAMYCAYFYALLRRDGDILVPPLPNPLVIIEGPINWFRESGDFVDLPDWPTRISVGPNMQVIPAVLLTLLFGFLLGLVLHYAIFRPLRAAPMLAKVVASIGLLLLLQAIVVRRFGSVAATVPKLYDTQPIQWVFPWGIRFTREQLFVVILVLIVTTLLWALFRFARFGLATRAASENEKGAVVLGFSPDMLAGTNWVLSTMLAALFGMVAASADSSVDPVTITLLVIPALSAVLVGNLSSFGITALAAFLISMAKPVILFAGTKSWFPHSGTIATPGIGELLPFIVIVLVLFLRGDALPTRGSIVSGRLPFAPTPGRMSLRVVGPIAIAVTFVALLLVATPSGRLGITNTLVGIVISSVVRRAHRLRRPDLARPTRVGRRERVPPLEVRRGAEHPVPALAAPGGGRRDPGRSARRHSCPARTRRQPRDRHVRVRRGHAGVHVQEPVDQRRAQRLAGQGPGTDRPAEDRGDLALGEGVNPWFGIFCLAVAAGSCYAIANIRRSATGRKFLATRSNERAAAAAGVNVSATKLLAFGTAAFVAGIAGALSSYRFGTVNPEYFGGLQSLTFFAFAYLGGISGVSGAVAAGFLVPGGVMFTILDSVFGIPGEFAPILGGIGLILTAILNPEGIAGGFRVSIEQMRSKRRGVPDESSAGVPSAPAPAEVGS